MLAPLMLVTTHTPVNDASLYFSIPTL